MATFHIDRQALKFTPETIESLQKAYNLPGNICQAHIHATEIGKGMREQLMHATEGLRLIHELDTVDDVPKQQMLTTVRRSLEAIASELSIRLYEEMPKTPVAWEEACRIVKEIFDRELGPGFVTPNKLEGYNSDSDVVADALLSSDAQGHFSHGVERIIRYIRLMREGKLRPQGVCQITEEYKHMGVFDGGCTFGQVGMQWGLQHALAKANEKGSYLIAGANMGHVGRLAYSIQQATREGFFCLGMLNTNGGRAALDMNGTDPLLGTNPFGMGVPDGEDGILIDIASTGQPEGAINVMLQEALMSPIGFLRERDGTMTTDPNRLYDPPTALLTPAGEHKGLAMGIMADVTIATLTGKGRTGTGKRKTLPDGVNNGWLALHRIESDAHHEILEAYGVSLTDLSVMEGTKPRGMFPGVRGNRAEKAAREGNVFIPKEIWNTVMEFHRTNVLPSVKM